jgi:hypothetical protein
MDIYQRKQKAKLLIFITAVIIAFASLFYSNSIVEKLSVEERKKIQLWAETIREIQEIPLDGQVSPTLYRILESNNTIPVILLNENGAVLNYMNINEKKAEKSKYLADRLIEMKAEHEPIIIEFSGGHKNFVYYEDSFLLKSLFYYPFVQIFAVLIFIIVSYLAFNSSRRAEQNQVWVGMSKETAHQLGTPISSLLAWVELLKLKDSDNKLIVEVEKDIKRLETITERFSGIGSEPLLLPHNISKIIENSIEYLKIRTSSKVEYIFDADINNEIIVPLNNSLFEWVIENICKNAIDAMNGKGKISFEIIKKSEFVYIDITDTGKGIPKSQVKRIFKPGFTTKKRGWGLGLSLARRIVEIYHKGKIFVKYSEIGKGTSFRIILKSKTL